MSSNYTSETVFLGPDGTQPGENNYTAGTVWQPEGQQFAEAVILTKGTMVGGYMITDVISDKGRESVVYRALMGGEDYALKVYKRELVLSETKARALMGIKCPYVAKLFDYGTYEGQPYEVYRYYKNGTVENIGKVDDNRLKHYIDQLNEALHSLHTAGGSTGMVHGDLKPSNIFLSDDRESLILGDFGVSNVKNADGGHFARICGTPEYAPPSTGLMDQMKKSPAYDYGALGLVVYYLATGYSYFVGCTSEQIAESWEKGIQLPPEMDSRLKMLLEGLLQFDENRRFGYEQVYDWYKGSFVQAVQPKKLYTDAKTEVKASLWFGIFDGQIITVTTVEELVLQMKRHWRQAIVKLQDANFYDFINKFYPDGTVSAKIRLYKEGGDMDAAVFKTIYTLSDNGELVYKDCNYGDISTMLRAMADQDANATELVTKGLLSFYVEAMGYPGETFRSMQEILALRNCSEYYRIRTVSYVFGQDKSYRNMKSINDLRTAVSNMTLEEIDKLVEDEDFLAWLYVAGMQELSVSLASRKGGTA